MPGQQSKLHTESRATQGVQRDERVRTKELLGSLALLGVGHFDGGGTERREELSGGGGQVGGAKSLACERLSTISDSAGISHSESGRTAGPPKFLLDQSYPVRSCEQLTGARAVDWPWPPHIIDSTQAQHVPASTPTELSHSSLRVILHRSAKACR